MLWKVNGQFPILYEQHAIEGQPILMLFNSLPSEIEYGCPVNFWGGNNTSTIQNMFLKFGIELYWMTSDTSWKVWTLESSDSIIVMVK